MTPAAPMTIRNFSPAPWHPAEGDLHGIITPALAVFPEMARRNIAAVIESIGGTADRWRPHLKTTKLPRIWRLLADAGIRHFKCATTREAAVALRSLDEWSIAGDVLVAYPHRGAALGRIDELAWQHPSNRVSILCEDEDVLDSTGPRVGVFIDVNGGMNRTGVPIGEGALIEGLAARAGDRFHGLHFYDGHIRDAEPAVRERAAELGYARLAALVDRLQRAGIPVGEVVTSGTTTFVPAARSAALASMAGVTHRVSPGTVVFHDMMTDECLPVPALRPAAVVWSRIVSRPTRSVVTCDAGSKSIAAEAGDPVAAAIGWPGLLARRPSEEHLPLEVIEGDAPNRGDLLALAPRHVCPTVNLADEAVIVQSGRITEIVPIPARGHEVRFTARSRT
jgi:D-serine deaminase-like pyridoxal phosphate-dependent protein